MRKFKCVKNYPGADLGTIVQYQLGAFPEYFDIKDAKRYNKKDIENYPEFWEEIVEKDYEVLECSYDILDNTATIYKIRRKSDGVEFKIGDKVCWKWLDTGLKYFTIKNFNIIEDTLKFNTVEESAQNFIFELVSKEYNLQHYKEPILTTEDGYECTLDDKVFGVLSKGSWDIRDDVQVKGFFDSKSNRFNVNTCWKFFKTAENRDKYIYENKPEFNRKQIRDALEYAKYAEYSQGIWVLALKIKERLKL